MRAPPSPRRCAGSPRGSRSAAAPCSRRTPGVEKISKVRGRWISIVMSSLIRPGRAVITSTRSERIDRLVDVVGDEQHGQPVLAPRPGQQLLHAAGGSARRARRTARPSAASRAGRRAPGRSRRAASCRPRAGSDRRRRSRSRPTRSRCSRATSARSRCAEPPAARTRRCFERGQPGKQRVALEDDAAVAARAVDRLRRRRAPRPRSPPRARRRSRAASTCRSREVPTSGDELVLADLEVDARRAPHVVDRGRCGRSCAGRATASFAPSIGRAHSA